jgi:hypothetical protein
VTWRAAIGDRRGWMGNVVGEQRRTANEPGNTSRKFRLCLKPFGQQLQSGCSIECRIIFPTTCAFSRALHCHMCALDLLHTYTSISTSAFSTASVCYLNDRPEI